MANWVGSEPKKDFKLRRFKADTLNRSVTHPINYLLFTLGLSVRYVVSEVSNHAIIFYIFYSLCKGIDSKVNPTFTF